MSRRKPPPLPPPPLGHGARPPAADPAVVARKVESMRPGAPGPVEQIEAEEITQVLQLVVGQVAEEQEFVEQRLRAATSRLMHETERTREFTRALSLPPSRD